MNINLTIGLDFNNQASNIKTNSQFSISPSNYMPWQRIIENERIKDGQHYLLVE